MIQHRKVTMWIEIDYDDEPTPESYVTTVEQELDVRVTDYTFEAQDGPVA